MSTRTAYEFGLLLFWAGLVLLIVIGFAVAGRGYCECDGCECCDEDYEPCTCTLACEPRGITAEQRCRLEDSCS